MNQTGKIALAVLAVVTGGVALGAIGGLAVDPVMKGTPEAGAGIGSALPARNVDRRDLAPPPRQDNFGGSLAGQAIDEWPPVYEDPEFDEAFGGYYSAPDPYGRDSYEPAPQATEPDWDWDWFGDDPAREEEPDAMLREDLPEEESSSVIPAEPPEPTPEELPPEPRTARGQLPAIW